MYINFKNNIRLAPFMIDTNWTELCDNWNHDNLNIIKSDFSLIEIEWEDLVGKESKTVIEKIWVNNLLTLPVLEKDVYKEIKIEKILELNNKELSELKVFRYKNSDRGMSITIKRNKIMNDLMKDFYFKMGKIKNIKKIGKENCLKIDELISKVFLIDNLLVISPKSKSITALKEGYHKEILKDIESLCLNEQVSKDVVENLSELKSLITLKEKKKDFSDKIRKSLKKDKKNFNLKSENEVIEKKSLKLIKDLETFETLL